MRLHAAAWVIGFSAAGHLVWEIGQLPLFTIWTSGTRSEQVFAVSHCTAGDVLITGFALASAIALGRAWSWPQGQWTRVIVLTVAIGIGYTAFSEWLNVYVRGSWSYGPAMPVLYLGTIGIGWSPLLQWLCVPLFALLTTRALLRRGAKRAVEDHP